MVLGTAGSATGMAVVVALAAAAPVTGLLVGLANDAADHGGCCQVDLRAFMGLLAGLVVGLLILDDTEGDLTPLKFAEIKDTAEFAERNGVTESDVQDFNS
ncbi:MAG: hypothetical protein AAB425_13065, partial [Bdellovibrionota bacterium]